MRRSGNFVLDKYWSFDTDAYILDYPIVKTILKVMHTLQAAYKRQSKDQEAFNLSFEFRNQMKLLNEKIQNYESYIQSFEEKWEGLKKSERVILSAFYFDGHETAEEVEQVLTKRYQVSKSVLYEKRNLALLKLREAVLKQEAYIAGAYWNFDEVRFLKDYPSNLDILQSKQELLEEMDEQTVPSQNYDKEYVQTTIKECTMLEQIVKKTILQSEIEAYQAYKDIFDLIWEALTEQERDVVDTYFYEKHYNKQFATENLMDRYHTTSSVIYKARRAVLDKICRLVNG